MKYRGDCKKCGGNTYQMGKYMMMNPVEHVTAGPISTANNVHGINVPQQNVPQQNFNNKLDPFALSLGIRGATTGLELISGMVDRNRQNQYDYQQQAQLGQMNAMPYQDYQPNPYSLYAKYGGNLKTHMMTSKGYTNKADMRMDKYRDTPGYQVGGLTRGLIPQPSYNYPFSPNDLSSKLSDSADYRDAFDLLKSDPNAYNDKVTNISLERVFSRSEPKRKYMDHLLGITNNVEEDYYSQNPMTPEQIKAELSTIYRPKDIHKKNGGWIQKAINPDHKRMVYSTK